MNGFMKEASTISYKDASAKEDHTASADNVSHSIIPKPVLGWLALCLLALAVPFLPLFSHTFRIGVLVQWLLLLILGGWWLMHWLPKPAQAPHANRTSYTLVFALLIVALFFFGSQLAQQPDFVLAVAAGAAFLLPSVVYEGWNHFSVAAPTAKIIREEKPVLPVDKDPVIIEQKKALPPKPEKERPEDKSWVFKKEEAAKQDKPVTKEELLGKLPQVRKEVIPIEKTEEVLFVPPVTDSPKPASEQIKPLPPKEIAAKEPGKPAEKEPPKPEPKRLEEIKPLQPTPPPVVEYLAPKPPPAPPAPVPKETLPELPKPVAEEPKEILLPPISTTITPVAKKDEVKKAPLHPTPKEREPLQPKEDFKDEPILSFPKEVKLPPVNEVEKEVKAKEPQEEVWHPQRVTAETKALIYLNTVPVWVKIINERGDETLLVQASGSPDMELSLFFSRWIQQRMRMGKPSSEWENEKGQPYGWVFLSPSFGGMRTRKLNPFASLKKNNIKENSVIEAHRKAVFPA